MTSGLGSTGGDLRRGVVASLALAALPVPVRAAEPAPDMSLYECVQNDGQTARGDDLIASEFEIVSIGRFDGLIVNLAHPLTGTRASCQLRKEQPK